MFGDAGEELLETTIKRGSRVKETSERAQGGGAKYILPHITEVTGGVVYTHPTDNGGESPQVERVNINIDLNNETMLMPNRSPPLTRENWDHLRQKRRSNLATVLKEGKPLDEDKITPLPKRRGPIGPTSGDLWKMRGGYPLTKFIILFPKTDYRKPRATYFFVNIF